MSKLLLGTRNRGKQDELLALLSSQNLEILTPQDLGLKIQVEETGATYAENAGLKAAAYATQSGLWTLADDSGLEVEVLDGAPGLRSARLAGEGKSDSDRRRLLLEMLMNHVRPWEARFRATIALSDPSGKIELAEGQCAGAIIEEERGVGGFGYDPIFLVHGTGKTMAELEMDEKNQISHRARALEAIRPVINASLGLNDGL
jgi:XTP/dITP diphosphohydrolase